jgi:hypothetical protein
MNRKLTLPAFALAMMVGVSACDLAVVNQNQPDRDRALASPGDVETLIASSYQPYWGTTHYYTGAAFFSNVQSNRHTSAWGNFGMNDLGREPREEIPNTTSYSYRGNLADGWEEGYQGISAASDGLRALDSGLEIGGPGGPDNARARAFAKMVQGLSNCLLANWYDRAFQIDETVDIAGELALADYNTMFSYAMGFLDEAEQTARGNTFTLPDTWINGNALTNTQMADLIVSFKARCRANQPRNPSEADAVSWNLVANDAADGLGVLVVEGLTQGPWWDGMKVYGMENSTGRRVPDRSRQDQLSGVAGDPDGSAAGQVHGVRRPAVSADERCARRGQVPHGQRGRERSRGARDVPSVVLRRHPRARGSV